LDNLAILRARIDALDESWVEILAQRFRVTEEIGNLKKAGNLPPVDQKREAGQMERVRQAARRHGLREEVAVKVLRTLIDEVVMNHKRL